MEEQSQRGFWRVRQSIRYGVEHDNQIGLYQRIHKVLNAGSSENRGHQSGTYSEIGEEHGFRGCGVIALLSPPPPHLINLILCSTLSSISIANLVLSTPTKLLHKNIYFNKHVLSPILVFPSNPFPIPLIYSYILILSFPPFVFPLPRICSSLTLPLIHPNSVLPLNSESILP